MGNQASNPTAIPITESNLPENYRELLRDLANSYRNSTTGTTTFIEPSRQHEIDEITVKNPYQNISEVNRDYSTILTKYSREFRLLNEPITVLHIKDGRNTQVIHYGNSNIFIKGGVSVDVKQSHNIPLDATLRTMTFQIPGTDQHFKNYYRKIQKAKEEIQTLYDSSKANERFMKETLIPGTVYQNTDDKTAETCMNRAVDLHTLHPFDIVGWNFNESTKYCSILATLGESRVELKFTSGTIRGYRDSENIPPLRVPNDSTDLNVIRSWISSNSQTNISRPFDTDNHEGRSIDLELEIEIKKALQMLYYLHVNHSDLLTAQALQNEHRLDEMIATPGRVLRLVAFLKMIRDYNSQIQSSLSSFSIEENRMETVEAFNTETQTQSLKDHKLATQEIYEKQRITLEQLTDSQGMATAQMVGFLISVGFLVLVSVIPSSTF
jgi:hypothetical protein